MKDRIMKIICVCLLGSIVILWLVFVTWYAVAEISLVFGEMKRMLGF